MLLRTFVVASMPTSSLCTLWSEEKGQTCWFEKGNFRALGTAPVSKKNVPIYIVIRTSKERFSDSREEKKREEPVPPDLWVCPLWLLGDTPGLIPLAWGSVSVVATPPRISAEADSGQQWKKFISLHPRLFQPKPARVTIQRTHVHSSGSE